MSVGLGRVLSRLRLRHAIVSRCCALGFGRSIVYQQHRRDLADAIELVRCLIEGQCDEDTDADGSPSLPGVDDEYEPEMVP